MTIINFSDKYELKIMVRQESINDVEIMLTDNHVASSRESCFLDKYVGIICYNVTLNKIEVIRKLLKQANIKYY